MIATWILHVRYWKHDSEILIFDCFVVFFTVLKVGLCCRLQPCCPCSVHTHFLKFTLAFRYWKFLFWLLLRSNLAEKFFKRFHYRTSTLLFIALFNALRYKIKTCSWYVLTIGSDPCRDGIRLSRERQKAADRGDQVFGSRRSQHVASIRI